MTGVCMALYLAKVPAEAAQAREGAEERAEEEGGERGAKTRERSQNKHGREGEGRQPTHLGGRMGWIWDVIWCGGLRGREGVRKGTQSHSV